MGRLPQTNTTVSRYLRQQKRVVTRLANATPYALSGTSVVGPGLTTVDERLVAGTPGGSRVELDSAGLRKYATDGTTVQVDLTGDVAAFSGLITGSEIIGGALKTASSGARVEIVPVFEPDGGRVKFYSGNVNETWPGEIRAFTSGADGNIVIESPGITDTPTAFVILTTATESQIGLRAERVYINTGGAIETGVTTLETAESSSNSYLMRRIFVVADVTALGVLVDEYVAAPRSRVIDSTHPLFVWQADASPGAQLQYTVDGTTFATIGGGGGGTTLFADPNADRLVFWDDSAGAFMPLTASTGLTLTGTDLTVRAATSAETGIVELATTAETANGTDTARATTPAGVKTAIDARTAWTDTAGIVELATVAEAVAGTDYVRAVTPEGVAAALAYTTGAWVAPTLANLWVNYLGGNRACEYRKMSDGTIMVRGQIKSGTTNAEIFTLPVGCRPTYAENFLCMAYLTAPALVNVGTDGVVKVIRYGTGGDNTYVSLAGIRFSYID